MNHKITYHANGTKTHCLDGKEVTEEAYREECQAREERRLREMLESGQPPHGISDCTFMAGSVNGSQFEGKEYIGDAYRRIAESSGGSTTGKKYLSGLARFPGDPEAWVDGRDDARRVVERRGWGCEGTVNVKPRDVQERKPGPDVAEDLVEKYTDQIADSLPDPHLVDREHLKPQVRERLKPKKRKTA